MMISTLSGCIKSGAFASISEPSCQSKSSKKEVALGIFALVIYSERRTDAKAKRRLNTYLYRNNFNSRNNHRL